MAVNPLSASPAPQRRRRWLFVLTALFVLPVLVLGLTEAGLRLAGVGYRTSFFLKRKQGTRSVYVENPDFGLRFFPEGLARGAAPVLMPTEKATNTYRIFIMGESAALGDPEPAFGFGRYLEVLLRDRYPGTHFEVVCTAMTAINSHAILPIARECAGLQGDMWVIYMGNNELVGPFGGATVLGPKAPPLPLIRASLAIKKLRLGQELSRLLDRLEAGSSSAAHWEGMKMFLQAQIPPGDPARGRSEANFQRNLSDLLRVAQGVGVKVVLCTLGSNLKDCAPFASLHPRGFSSALQGSFQQAYAQGQKFQAGGQWSEAISNYLHAANFDPTFAELQFRLGRAYLSLTNTTQARQGLARARDADALPFRASSSLNAMIRNCARQTAGHGVSLADAEEDFSLGIPGTDLFYEHVHLNFEGNYRLARLVADQVALALPEWVVRTDKHEWLSRAACEGSLAVTDWDRHRVYQNILQREQEEPFTRQLNHAELVQALQEQLQTFKAGMTRDALPAALEVYRHALAVDPDDFQVRANYAKLLTETGRLSEAATEWERVKALLPGRPGPALYLGKILLRLEKYADAEAALREVVQLRPDLPEAWDCLAQSLNKERRFDESIQACQRALKVAPSNAVVHLHLADALAAAGRRPEAMSSLRDAIRCRPDYWEARYLLGVELALQQHFPEAAEQFALVVQERPQFAPGHLNLGVALVKLNRFDDALHQFEAVTRLEPTNRTAADYLARLQAMRKESAKP